MARDRQGGGGEGGGANPYAIGCLLALPGFFGGGMIAVGVGKVVGVFTRCKPPEGWPICNTLEYLSVGALIGLVVLPGVAVWLTRRNARARQNSGRS